MTRYSVPFTTYVNTAITVEVPDDVTDPESIVAAAEERLQEVMPSLCYQCAGGYHGRPELDLGDDWTVPDHDGTPDITKLEDEL